MSKDIVVASDIVDAEIVEADEVTDGRAVLPPGLTTDEQENAGELSVAELAALDWEGDGGLRNNFGSLADARHDNTVRAGFALLAVEAFAERVGGIDSEPIEQQISDLLGDMMHLCDALGLSLDELAGRGAYHYDPETRGEF